jgi:hypothetical protein
MEPTYRDGDLVFARTKPSYRVGDVVAYQPEIGQRFPVIHRIVAIEGDHYITQGDNRAEPDGWLATDSNIFGASWIRIPYGGRVIAVLRQPTTWLGAALGLASIGLAAGVRADQKPIRRRTGGRHLQHGSRPRRRGAGKHISKHASTSLATLLVPLVVILFAFSSSAAVLAVDGGVLQSFPIGAGSEVRTEGQEAPSPATTISQPALTITNLELQTYSSGSVRITLPGPVANAQEVLITVDQPTIASAPPAVTVLEGTSQIDVPVSAGSVPGGMVITASGPGFIEASGLVTVAARTMVLQVADPVTQGAPTEGILVLDEPAPAGGIALDLASSDPAIIALEPATVVIAEGQTTALFAATAAAAGDVVLTASAPGYGAVTVKVSVTSNP